MRFDIFKMVRWSLLAALVMAGSFLPAQAMTAADIRTSLLQAPSAQAGMFGVVVRLAPGVDPVKLSTDYQAIVVGAIAPLSIYRLQSANPQLLAALRSDPRVLSAEADTFVQIVRSATADVQRGSG